MVQPAHPPFPEAPAGNEEPVHHLEAFSYDDRHDILPGVARALEGAGAFVVERRSTSPTQTELRFEVQVRSIVDLYSLLIGSGVELTRGSHLLLTGLCTLRLHRKRHFHPFRVLTIHLELNFLEDLSLSHSFLSVGATA